MAVTPIAPSAAGTPVTAAPAAVGTGAETTPGSELQDVDDILMAELGDGPEPAAGDEADADETDTPETDDETEESADAETEEDAAEDGEEDESDSADNDDDDSTEDDADPAASETAQGTPKAVREQLEKAGLPKGLLKRIDKAFAKNAEYRDQIATLEQQQQQQGDPVILTPSERHPLSDVSTPAELDERIQAAEQWLEWCEEHPDGGRVGTGDKARELTPDDVKAQRKWANTILRKAPERMRYLETKAQHSTAAKKLLPEMFQKGTPEYNAAQALLKATPEWLNQPTYEVELAYMVRGLRMTVRESQGYTYLEVPPDKSKSKEKSKESGKPSAAAPAAKAAPQQPSGRPRASAPPVTRPPGRASGTRPDVATVAATAAKSGDWESVLDAELA